MPLLKQEEGKAEDFKQKALVRTKLRVQHEGKDSIGNFPAIPTNPKDTGAWASDFENDVASLILGLSGGQEGYLATPFGGSVDKIKDLIQNDMMPKVVAAHEAQQARLNELSALIAACDSERAEEFTEVQTKETTYKSKSTEHKECRDQENILYNTNVDCHARWIT